GATVSRTADDLVRYHGKILIVDRSQLFVLGFNYTYLDMDKSRSFGITTRDRRLVQEALKLYECDTNRQVYVPSLEALPVSPLNAREALARLIRHARRQLLIYDPKLSDDAMIRLLRERAAAGVDV